MRVLVWQWGRRGAGPKMAVELARGLNALEGCQAVLSLSEKAEILRADPSVTNDLSVRTIQRSCPCWGVCFRPRGWCAS